MGVGERHTTWTVSVKIQENVGSLLSMIKERYGSVSTCSVMFVACIPETPANWSGLLSEGSVKGNGLIGSATKPMLV